MPAPGLMGGLGGALTNPAVQKGIQNTANRVKGALTTAPGPIGDVSAAVKSFGNIGSSMASKMGSLAKMTGPMMPARSIGNMGQGIRSMFRGPQF